MKKSILAIVLLVSIQGMAQKKEPTEKPAVKTGTIKVIASHQDSVKQKPVPMDTVVVLKGTVTAYRLLYLQVVSPGDVTPNQKQALTEWIRTTELETVPKKAKP